jgi:3'-phosphoadenosine 5'-phosphosulfate sulfotransferase (PAPS reductase)/FAD synthetase
MNTKKYGWNGWKMPVFNLNDPDYCEYGCPICTRAREGNPLAQFFQKMELLVTFGGCWWGRARRRKYGVTPNEPIPEKMQENQA